MCGHNLKGGLGIGRSVEELYFSTGQSSFGSILVASGERGVVAILVGKTAARLIEDLGRRFPDATLTRGGRDDQRFLERVLAFVEMPDRDLDLPLDIRGTEFQRQVWLEVREIPLGETTSFTEIARRIGSDKAVRAVGNACTTNNLSFAIPCHRVVRHDGTLSGSDHQGALLGRERAAVAKRARSRVKGSRSSG